MRKIGVGVIGYGYWGPNLVRNIADQSECDLVMVCDRNQNRLRSVGTRYPAVRCTANVKEVFSDNKIDAVVISTPVSTHFSLAKGALLAGKHVLVEKPLATCSKEASMLVHIAKENKRQILAGHTFIYSPPVRKVKELLDKNYLGKVHYMDFSRVNLGLFQPDVNVLWDLSPHDISIVLFWLDHKPCSVRAQAKSFVRKGIEEVGYLTIEFKSGVMAHIHVSWLAPVKLRRVSVVGSERMLVYDDTENVEKVKIYNQGVLKNPETFGEFQLTYRSGNVMSPKVDSTEPLAIECLDFIQSIRTGKKPIADGNFGLKVVQVLEAAQKSLRRNGAPVRL